MASHPAEHDPIVERTANVLGALALTVSDALRDLSSVAGLHSEPSVSALATVAGFDGLTIRQLASTLGLSHSGTVRVVDGLVAQDLVVRSEHSDGRAVALTGTSTGRRVARRVRDRRLAELRHALDGLDLAEVHTLATLLAKVAGNVVATPDECDRACRLCDERICPPTDCPLEQAIAAAR